MAKTNEKTTGAQRLAAVVSLIQDYVGRIDEDSMRELVLSHYKTLQLMGEDGEWLFAELEPLTSTLIPEDLSSGAVGSLIDRMAELCGRNEVLMHFFETEGAGDFPGLRKKVAEEGAEVIPDTAAYALVMESLCRVLSEDWTLLEKLSAFYKTHRKATGAGKELPLFHKIKLFSVEKPVVDYIRAHKSGIINPKAGRLGVRINILEAVWTDFKSGIRGNAAAGKVLADYRCGSVKSVAATDEGPSGWSPDGKRIQRSYPLPEKWADLYQAWNMCFVTRFGDFPYILVKLLIPLVADYEAEPKSYIYNRVMGLYTYLNFSGFDYLEKKKNGDPVIDWSDRDLSLAFGRSNAEMARRYKEDVDRLRKN